MIRAVRRHARVEWLPVHCWLSPFEPPALICDFAAGTMFWLLGLKQSWI
jgi:hypothetical protein